MYNNRHKAEKEVWETIRPYLDLPTSKSANEQDYMKRYINARRVICEAVKDPMFVKRVQERKASVRELLMKDFSPETFAKLFNTDICACIPEKKKR